MNAYVYKDNQLLLITPVPIDPQWWLHRRWVWLTLAHDSSSCSPAGARDHQVVDVDEEYATRRHPLQNLPALR